MGVLQIAILAILALGIGRLTRGRQLAMLAASTFVIFWLQPPEPFVSLVFWLPVATLVVTLATWVLTSDAEARGWKENWPAVVVMAAVVLVVDLNRYFKLTQIYMADTPPIGLAGLALIVVAILLLVLARWQKMQAVWRLISFLILLLIFVFLKTPALTSAVLGWISSMRGQNPDTVNIAFSWLGFSYLAFRLLHTIRDRQSGRLPSVTLAEYVNYAIFFPSFTAGPIDRIERFVNELRNPLPLADPDWLDAGTRLFVGLFKKFVLADTLAVISISDVLVSQVKSAGWLWVFLYAYAFRIYLDFSGYTDIAIGLGRLLGIRLPENFTSPYLKTNLAQFWNSWHITLTQWFRSYFFNPLTRWFRTRNVPWPAWAVILITQISTMVLIGLWHGVALGFIAWGLWHGLGLFLQNRWSEYIRNRLPAWFQTSPGRRLLQVAGVFLTFNYVSLGWLFFNLSTPVIALRALTRLFGLVK